MAKRRKQIWDDDRTGLLNLDELVVQKGPGDKNNYFVWLQDPEVDFCPICGCEVLKVQDLFPKSYYDVIVDHGQKRLITLYYQFYKYRCQNPDCGHIFAKDIHFASQYDNVTFRLEDDIASFVSRGESYSNISTYFSNYITRQAVGQIFNRWISKNENQRNMNFSPETIAVISGRTDKDQYSLFLNLDDGIRIFDIQYGVSSGDLSARMRQFAANGVKTVLSDCDPTIVDAINDNLTGATYIIPVQYWLKLVREDFRDYAHDILRWSPVRNKDSLIVIPASELTLRKTDRDYLLDTRPAIKQPYMDFNELRDLIYNREFPWTMNDIDAWTSHIDPDFRGFLEATIFRLNENKDLIYQHELHRGLVPEKLFALTEQLEDILSKAKTFSDAQLKARVLYSVPADLENWKGIPIEEVITALKDMKIDQRRQQNEYE